MVFTPSRRSSFLIAVCTKPMDVTYLRPLSKHHNSMQYLEENLQQLPGGARITNKEAGGARVGEARLRQTSVQKLV